MLSWMPRCATVTLVQGSCMRTTTKMHLRRVGSGIELAFALAARSETADPRRGALGLVVARNMP